MSSLRRYAPVFTLVLAIACLYLYHLSGVGVLGPDEPRYLAIGRAMHATGDYVTPHLWGRPWFEKPPLLYWLASVGTALPVSLEAGGRLPVALLSLAFLATMFLLVKPQFGVQAAAVSTVMLATSAGWLADSNLGTTDLPLSVFFSLAILLALPLVEEETPSATPYRIRFVLIGLSLGFAALAKGPLPIVLALPLAWFLRDRWRSWWLIGGALALTALPWYIAVYVQNGRAFVDEFFWKHNVERLYSASLLHVQPVWYYIPIALAFAFPWTPLFGLLLARQRVWDRRRRFLASCFLFGLVVLSLSLNKLPSYILPLIPSAFVLLAASIDFERLTGSLRLWLLPCAVLIGLLPLGARLLPETLQIGRLTVPSHLHIGLTGLFYMTAPIATVILAKRSWVGILLVLCFVAGGLFVKIVSFPVIDRLVSARGTWRKLQHTPGTICNDWLGREWDYGLAFYRGEPYPVCGTGHYDYALQSHGKNLPVLVRKHNQ